MEAFAKAGISSETCDKTRITYYQKVFTASAGACPGLMILLNGIGLDKESLLPFLQHVSLPSIRLSYPFKTFVHIIPTVPGFEPTEEPVSEGLLSMDDQARLLTDFIRGRVRELNPEKIVLYTFSYGSDLLVPILSLLAEDRAIQPLLARVVVAEINVSSASCFITSRISSALEGVRAGATDGLLRAAHTHFFTEILKAYTAGDISKTLLAELGDYFTVIITKNWYQLATNCREVTTSPEGRIRKLLATLKWLPHTEADLIFSDPSDKAVFGEMLTKWSQGAKNTQVFDASPNEHFYHMGKEGILKNLCREFPDH